MDFRVLFWLCLALFASADTGKDAVLEEFSRYETVAPVLSVTYPQIGLNRSKRDLGLQPVQDDAARIYRRSERLKFTAFNRTFHLDLELNTALVPEGFHVIILGKDGRNETIYPKAKNCHYRGKLRDYPRSVAAVSLCDNKISGFIEDGDGETYHMKAADRGKVLVTRESDALPKAKFCGVDLSDQINRTIHDDLSQSRSKTRTRRSIKPPTTNNADSLYVELVLVADSKMYSKYDGDQLKITSRFIDIASVVNALYWPLNIFVALVGVEIWTAGDRISIVNDSEATLRNFLKYRKDDLVLRMPNDNAYFITANSFSGNVVGKALKGQMCTYEFSGGVAKDHSRLPGPVGSTIAHELGHNFGMEHDYTDCKCPEDRCIMTPASIGLTPSNWSSCSRKYLEDHLAKGIGSCLKNVPKFIMTDGKPYCGNGFLEDGEECDCGPEEYCKNKCCTPATCRLSVNSTCGHGECCDMDTCNLRPGATVCRQPKNDCDLPEFCDGERGPCPDDVWKADGIKCRGGEAFCFNGACSTPADQCTKLWGSTGAVAEDKCFGLNVKGNTEGNCGHDRVHNNYSQCAVRDVKCGLLHCTSQVDKLALGVDSTAMIVQSFMPAKTTYINCKAGYVDLGLSIPDPGMVPSGAKCAEDSMCYNAACVPVSNLPGPACPGNCNGAGICNHLGHCHCDDGYAPPYCSGSGYGGSVDSGPAVSPDSYRRFRNAMLIIFLLVVPVILTALFLYIMRYRIRDWMLIRAKARRTGGASKPRPDELPKTRGAADIARNQSLREMPVSGPVQANDTVVTYSNGKSPITQLPTKPWPVYREEVHEAPPPLPAKPPKAVRDQMGSPVLTFSPNRSPPRNFRSLNGPEEAPLNLGDDDSPGVKPVRPAPPPPPAGASNGSLKKPRPGLKPPDPPVRPPGLAAKMPPHAEAANDTGPQKNKNLVAEMARRFENRRTDEDT